MSLSISDEGPAHRTRILTFVHYYLPAYKSGGPVRTISNLVERLGDEFEFRIVTTDRDALDDRPFPGVTLDEWTRVGKASVFYASRSGRRWLRIAHLINSTPHDVLYLNSYFSPVSTLGPLILRRLCLAPRKPLLLAPRGEFSLGALSLKSVKKRLYLRLAEALGLYRDAIWQASSRHEAADIARAMGVPAERIRVAPNLTALEAEPNTIPNRGVGDALRIVYLSRVSPVKNLVYALDVLAGVSSPVVLDIYGQIGDQQYWQRCQLLVEALPSDVRVNYRGPVPHEQVASIISKYDLFFLPTRGENYGHAIIEALAAGVPVLISNQTPWIDLQPAGVGWSLPLDDPRAFLEVIESQARITVDERRAQRLRAMEYAHAVSQDKVNVAKNRALFMEAAEMGKP